MSKQELTEILKQYLTSEEWARVMCTLLDDQDWKVDEPLIGYWSDPLNRAHLVSEGMHYG